MRDKLAAEANVKELNLDEERQLQLPQSIESDGKKEIFINILSLLIVI